jgi:D-lactate dehydrogenase (cytochrome)
MVRPIAAPEVDTVLRAIEDLQSDFGPRVQVGDDVRRTHGTDEGWHAPVAPDAVVEATSTTDVVAVVRTCARHGVPVVPFGAGTSLEGHVAALEGGISLDLSQMTEILEVNNEDLDCRVQAGVRRNALNERLSRDGLFFPIDPGADATLGGMTATRASGTNAVRYGTMRENVLALTAVLADGRIVRTGSRARKSSAGYDLTRLLVGSEGTLGVITEVALRLHGIPEQIASAVCSFANVTDAVQAVIETIQLGVPVARAEFLDSVQVDACNRHSGLDLPVQPLLLFEFHGSPATVADDAAAVERIARDHDANGWTWATDQAERTKLWSARHNAYYAALALRPGSRGVPTDVCVPISKLAQCVDETRNDLDASGLIAPIVGHVGDGNFHVILLFDPDDPSELSTALDVHDRMVRRALEMGGTCTGEHGVGYGKLAFMGAEHDEGALDAMRAIKRALDPQNIFNPGKLVPPATAL